APARVFQHMSAPAFVAAQRSAQDVLRIHHEATMAVVEGGRLSGVVRRVALEAAGPGTRVGALVEWAPALRADQPLDDVASLVPVFGADPIPWGDRAGGIVGRVAAASGTGGGRLAAP